MKHTILHLSDQVNSEMEIFLVFDLMLSLRCR